MAAAAPTAEAIAAGEVIFNGGTCRQCHGAGGKGTMTGPSLADATWEHSNGSVASLMGTITNGITINDIRDPTFRRPMPARGGPTMNLTDAQVVSVASYVWSLSHPKK